MERSVDAVNPVEIEISTETTHYKPMFGSGDSNADMANGVIKYGLLTINSKGETQLVDYGREGVVYYVLEGTGTLNYRNEDITISKDDFFYIPIDTEHGFSNPREGKLQLMVMGFYFPADVEVQSDIDLQLANARDIEFQTLEQNNHGPANIPHRHENAEEIYFML